MNTYTPPPPRLSVEEKVDDLNLKGRDCRSCRAFRPDPGGQNFGWCTAFEQYVKLYHPAGEFWSQCQFKVISRAPVCAGAAAETPAPAPARSWSPMSATPATA